MLPIYSFPPPVLLSNARQGISTVAGSLVLVGFIGIKDK